jgi:hypothetical protein
MAKKLNFFQEYWWIIMLVGFVVGWLGNSMINADKPINTPSNQFCYNTNPEYSVANPVTVLPSDWGVSGFGNLCNSVNLGKHCAMTDVCPTCAISKVSCICKS